MNNFNITQNVGPSARVAELGQGMLTPLYVTLFPAAPQYPDIKVWSPKNTDGAVIYDHDGNNRKTPPGVPVYAYERKGKDGKVSKNLYQIAGPVPAQAVQRQFELAAFSGLGVHLTTSPADLEAAALVGGFGAILLRILAEVAELGAG